MDATKIKHALIDAEVKQADLARKLNVSEALISQILSGKRKGYRHRAQIARELGVSVEKLFNGGRKRRTA